MVILVKHCSLHMLLVSMLMSYYVAGTAVAEAAATRVTVVSSSKDEVP